MSKMAVAAYPSAPIKGVLSVTEHNIKFLRVAFFIITAFFIIIGTVMFVLGIAMYLEYHDFNFFMESVKSGPIITPSILTAIVGFALLGITFFGFVGNLKQSTCMINFYAIFLIVIVIIKVVIVSLAFTIDGHVLMRYIYLPIHGFGSDPEIESEINNLQCSLRCCGGYSFLDYLGMEYAEHQNTTYIMQEHEGNLIVMVLPETCCAVRDGNRCMTMHGIGCKEALANITLQNASAIGILGVSVLFIVILGIVFALLLARVIRRLKSERALMEWKIKEQTIIGRQEAINAEIDRAIYIAQTQSVSLA